jgi:Cof subfamily protein (haloacid dehalogenase superfamily)
MTTPRHRLVALDLDGTALTPDHRVLASTREAVARAAGLGVDTLIVTGRHHTGAAPFHHDLGLVTPSICCNGTYVWDWHLGRAILADPLPRAEALTLLRLCRAHRLEWMVYTVDAMVYEVETEHLAGLAAWAATIPEDRRPVFRHVDDFDALIAGEAFVWKFVVMGGAPEEIAAWQREAEATGLYAIERSWVDRWDVVRRGNSKGRRLVEWAASRGIAAAEIIAFGDNHNDTDMIRAAGLGIAMGNAEPELKAVADAVTAANDADGIALALDRFLFA